jgi:rhamnosyltransferase subunit B
LAIARALRERGHEVLFLSQEAHRAEVEAQNLNFHAIASLHDHTRTVKHPDLWHPIRGFGVLWRHLVVPAIDPTVDVLQSLMGTHPRGVKVLASPLVVGARLLYDLAPYDLTTAHTAPAALRSCRDPLFLGAWKVPAWWPAAGRSLLWRALDSIKLHPMARPALDTWRARHQLPAIDGSVFGQWLHSPHRTVALFPADFGPNPGDWPVPVAQFGFPRYLGSSSPPQDPDLAAFLADPAERPLLVFYPGSAPTRQHRRLSDLAHQCAQLGAKCILISPVDSTKPAAAPDLGSVRLLIRHHVDIPTVLRRSWLFVHHGGIGATAHGLATGIAQVIDPAAYDQFDNAWRVTRKEGHHRLDASTSAPQLLAFARRPTPPTENPSTAEYPYSIPGKPNVEIALLLDMLES